VSKFSQKQRRHRHPDTGGGDSLPSVSGIGLPRCYRFEVSDYKGVTYGRAQVEVAIGALDWETVFIEAAPEADVEADTLNFWADESYQAKIRFEIIDPSGWTEFVTLPAFTYVNPNWTMSAVVNDVYADPGVDVIAWGTFEGAHWQWRSTCFEGVWPPWSSASAPRQQVEFRFSPPSEEDPYWFQCRFVDIDTGYSAGFVSAYVEPV